MIAALHALDIIPRALMKIVTEGSLGLSADQVTKLGSHNIFLVAVV